MRLSATLAIAPFLVGVAAANTISGVITNAADSQPVANATVLLTNVASPTPQFLFTGADGRFSFDFSAFSVYDLRVFAGGYYGDSATVIPIPVFNPNPVVNFALDVRPTGTGSISGTITNAATGSRVNGAIVEAYDANRPDAIYTATLSLPLPSPAPNYTLGSLATGTYRLRVSANGFIPAERTGVSVTSGTATPGIDIALVAGQASIAGTTLIGNTARPLEGSLLALLDSELRPVGTATTAADGAFLFSGLGPGTYTATATHQGFSASGTLVLNLGQTESRTGIVIRLENDAAPRPPATLAGDRTSGASATLSFPASVDESGILGHGDLLEYRVYAASAGAPSVIATVPCTDAVTYSPTVTLPDATSAWTVTVRGWDGFLEGADSPAAVLASQTGEAWMLY